MYCGLRRTLCALLLSCVLGLTAAAVELTTAQAQMLVNAAQRAQSGGPPVDVVLTFNDNKQVSFKVTRDPFGNALARPVPGPDSQGIDIAQVSMQFMILPNGLYNPTGLVLITNAQVVISYAIQLNPDGMIAGLLGPGGSGGGVPAPALMGGLGSNPFYSPAPFMSPFGWGGFPGFNYIVYIVLPAGTGTSDSASRFQP